MLHPRLQSYETLTITVNDHIWHLHKGKIETNSCCVYFCCIDYSATLNEDNGLRRNELKVMLIMTMIWDGYRTLLQWTT
jgi:hypothetical protein